MRNWIVKVIEAAPKNMTAELEVTAETIDHAIEVTRQMWPEGFVYSVVAKKPKATDVNARQT